MAVRKKKEPVKPAEPAKQAGPAIVESAVEKMNELQIMVAECPEHGTYVCNPEGDGKCPCCKCVNSRMKEKREQGMEDIQEYRYIVIPECDDYLFMKNKEGGKDFELVVAKTHEGGKYIPVEMYNMTILCPCCCCDRDKRLEEKYGKNIDSELEYEKNVDILLDGLYQKGEQ